MHNTVNAYHATKLGEGNYDSPVGQFIGLVTIVIMIGFVISICISSSKD